jgi:uncharacterized protein (DUF2384 family)
MEQDVFRAMRGELGDTLLAKLLGRSVASVRLYANGRRVVPALVARRLEWVRRVAFSLAGGYDSKGMRAWFDRPRVQLGQRSPLDMLGPDWLPSDAGVEEVERLAAELRGPG